MRGLFSWYFSKPTGSFERQEITMPPKDVVAYICELRQQAPPDVAFGYPYYEAVNAVGSHIFMFPCPDGVSFRPVIFGLPDAWLLSQTEHLRGQEYFTEFADEIDVPSKSVVDEDSAASFFAAWLDGRPSVLVDSSPASSASRLKTSAAFNQDIFRRWREQEFPIALSVKSRLQDTCCEIGDIDDFVAFTTREVLREGAALLRDSAGKMLELSLGDNGLIDMTLEFKGDGTKWRLLRLGGMPFDNQVECSVVIREWLTNGEVPRWIEAKR